MALLLPHSSVRPTLRPQYTKFSPLPPPPIPALSSLLPTPTPIFPYPTSRLSLRFPLKRALLIPPLPSSFSFTQATDSHDTPIDLGGGEEDEDLTGSPWAGAVVYRRDASAAHVEYCTTLERLGLGKLSTGLSRSRASAMGMRLPARRARGSLLGDGGTPVLVSVDVARRKRRLRLDGVVRTVITLACNRCAEPAAECIFSNFTLLLTEDPIEEPDEINMGVIFGADKLNSPSGSSIEGEDDENQIDLDDKLYFPAEEKEIDISKHIRDIVHVEITINAICDSSCKGLCLRCGTNLNRSKCNCNKETSQDKDREKGPLKNLRKQMQQR